ncbi:unnamed protein product [Blepharisma stoltei]|uniref:Uncharacterized protein n=1 Tax=Blepharisma stoltei TaxID=1481888 RepID=A0AAU9J8H2_9CILI|nr:unnamed protein product [Blepharisma stoltei]
MKKVFCCCWKKQASKKSTDSGTSRTSGSTNGPHDINHTKNKEDKAHAISETPILIENSESKIHTKSPRKDKRSHTQGLSPTDHPLSTYVFPRTSTSNY